MTLPRRLRVAPLLLTCLLMAGPLAAATYDHRPGEAWQARLGVPGALAEAWAFLSRIWEKEGGSLDPFGKEGSSTDPFGKEGSGTDPFGRAGSSIDPFGNPTPHAWRPSIPRTSAPSRPASGN